MMGGRPEISPARSSTYSMIGWPAARGRILIVSDFIRVPRPAARMTMSKLSVIPWSILGSHPLDRAAVAVVQTKDRLRQRGRVVPHEVPLGDDVTEERRHAELADGVDVELHRVLILRRVRGEDRLRRAAAVEHHHVGDE